MKRSVWIVLGVFLGIFWILPGVFALSTTLASSYQRGETMIIRIDGALTQPLAPSQIEVLRGHVAIPLTYELQQLGTQHYLWAIAPETAGNYTLMIHNVRLQEGASIVTQEYASNFTVTGNRTEYFVTPGTIVTTKDFALDVVSYFDTPQKISVSFPYPREITIVPGTNKISFSLAGVKMNQMISLVVGKYTLPLYLRGNASEVPAPIVGSLLEFVPSEIRQTLGEKETFVPYVVKLLNRAPIETQKITLDYNSDVLKIEPSSFKISGNGTAWMNVSFEKSLTTNRTRESVYARAGNESATLLVNVGLEPKIENPAKNASIANASLPYCAQLSGILCASTDTCVGTMIASKEGGICCAGACQEAPKKSSAWIGWLLGAIGVLILVYLGFVYKNKQTQGKDVFARKVASAEKKMP